MFNKLLSESYSAEHLCDARLAGFLQVYLHQVHLDDTATLAGISSLNARFIGLVDRVARLPVEAHPTVPALLAGLRPLAQRAAGGIVPAPELKRELEKLLYLGLRRVLASNASAATATAFAFAPLAELPAVDYSVWV